MTHSPSSNWAYDHAADASAHHARYTDAEALTQAETIIDDTPADADLTHSPSSNWAYDHKADAAAHHAKTVSSDIDHGSVGGLADDDHSQYVHISTQRTMTTTLVTLDHSYWRKSSMTGQNDINFETDRSNNWALRIWEGTTYKVIFNLLASGDLELAYGGVKASGHYLSGYAGCGDKSAWDFAVGNFTRDGAWHDLDLSALAPAGTQVVLLRLYVVSTAASKVLGFRKNGQSSTYNSTTVYSQVGSVGLGLDVIVEVDSNRIIEYYVQDTTWATINVLVKGYWTQ